MKLELGGGTKAKGDGFVNMDLVPTADVVHDLSCYPWPLEDGSVTAVYSSHCLEHVPDPLRVLYEVCRVCREGAAVEIRVPMVGSDLDMVWGHLHVLGPVAVRNVCELLPRDAWAPPVYSGPRRLRLVREEYRPSVLLAECRRELRALVRGLSDEVIMKWFPRACHEVAYHFAVAPNEFLP